jgi:hypothetical protein
MISVAESWPYQIDIEIPRAGFPRDRDMVV